MRKITYASLCKYDKGEAECPSQWKEDVKGKFWYGEMMFCTNRISIQEWRQHAKEVIRTLSDEQLKFASAMSLEQFGMVLYIETLFQKWCPYDDTHWILEY